MVLGLADHRRNRDLGSHGSGERQVLGRAGLELVHPDRLEIDGVGQGDARCRVDVSRGQNVRDSPLGSQICPLVDRLAGLGIVPVVDESDAGAEPGTQRVEVGGLKVHAVLREDRVRNVQFNDGLFAGVIRGRRRIGRVEVRVVVEGRVPERFEERHGLGGLCGRAEAV